MLSEERIDVLAEREVVLVDGRETAALTAAAMAVMSCGIKNEREREREGGEWRE